MNDLTVVDYAPALAIIPKPGKLELVYNSLLNASPHMQVYKKEEISVKFHYNNSPRITPIIGILEEGWSATVSSYYNEQKDTFKGGNHGYDHELDSMQVSSFFPSRQKCLQNT